MDTTQNKPPESDRIPTPLAQALLISDVPDNTEISTTFDGRGLDPKSLVGKRIAGYSYFDYTLAHVVLRFTDNMKVVLTHKDAASWDEDDDDDEPELELGEALEKALRDRIDGEDTTEELSPPSLMIEAAVFGMKRSDGWDPSAGRGDMGMPDEQQHRILGLRLEGMDKMGWVMSQKEVWDTDYECPHEISWADVIIAETVGRSPKEDLY